MTDLGRPTMGRCSESRKMPWNQHPCKPGSERVRLFAPRDFSKIINFSVVDLLSCNVCVTLSSITPPKSINLQCGSERLTLRVSVRPTVRSLALDTYLFAHDVLGLPRPRYAGMLILSSIGMNSTVDSTLLKPLRNPPKFARLGITFAS